MNALIANVALHQDRASFEQIFKHFAPRVKAFVLGQITHPQMAEEIVQETFVNVWRKAKLFDSEKAAASTWIFTIARNLRIDHLRKENRPEPDINDPAFMPDPEPMAFDLISHSQDAARLNRSIEGLPEEQKEVLRLAFFADKSHPEVAEALKIPLGTVKSRIRLAISRLRTELEGMA
ncbi:MAG: sigma-70 family RNA polymerase sigma factor [Rhodospirillales bacterium]|nr:sigma-70 family RNA polymerase sigma factor [Rhodospirillales bacterium]